MAEFTIQGTTDPFISAQLAQGETATGKRQPVTSADLRDRGSAVLTFIHCPMHWEFPFGLRPLSRSTPNTTSLFPDTISHTAR